MKWIAVSLLLLVACLAGAHPANVPSAQIKVTPEGRFVARIRFDALAFATGVAPKHADDVEMDTLLDGPEADLRNALAEAAQRFRREFQTLPGGVVDDLEFPTVQSVRRFLDAKPVPRLPVMLTAVVRGHLPSGTATVAFRYPAIFDTLIQTVEIPYQEPVSEPVPPGNTSSTIRIPTPDEIAQTEASFRAPREPIASVAPTVAKPPATIEESTPKDSPVAQTVTPRAPIAPGRPKPVQSAPAAAKIEPETTTATATSSPILTYLQMGFTHILPEGIDHILFVLGLFLLGTSNRALVKQITAFTVAHSITLALASFEIVRIPGRIIEPVIALSIAFVAIENLCSNKVHKWRTAVVFVFGLVHGLGFAEVFHDAGLRGSGLITALVSFNVGVELGQGAVVCLALLLVGWFRSHAKYRVAVVLPGSAAIAAIALVWTVQRIWS